MHISTHRFMHAGSVFLLLIMLSAGMSHAQVNDPRFGEQTYLQAINADEAWNVTTGSPDVKIAIIGGGNVLPTHEDLGSKTSVRAVGLYSDGYTLRTIPSSSQSSLATGVAGVAAAVTNNGTGIAGVNWRAPILSYDPATLTSVPEGMEPETGFHVLDIGKVDDHLNAAVDAGAEIIITPFLMFPRDWDYLQVTLPLYPIDQSHEIPEDIPVIGGTMVDGVLWANWRNLLDFIRQLLERDPRYAQAVRSFKDAYVQGRTIVAPAGDFEGTTGGLPAGLSNAGFVITTGSVNSSFDGPFQYSASSSTNVDVVAPGVDITTTLNTGDAAYGEITSTTMSAGLVGGVASLLKSYDASLRPEDIRQVLRRTTVDLGSPGRDAQTGFGRIDAAAALDYVQERMFTRGIATNGSVTTSDEYVLLTLEHGVWGDLAAGRYYAYNKKKVTFTVDLPPGEDHHVWIRLSGTRGWSNLHYQDQARWAEIESIDHANQTITFSTYVYGDGLYEVGTWRRHPQRWHPASPGNARVAYTITAENAPPPPPPAPQNLRLTNTTATFQAPALAWNAVAEATSYKLYRCIEPAPGRSCINRYLATTSTTTHTDETLFRDHFDYLSSYPDDQAPEVSYRVRAVNAHGTSTSSNSVSVWGHQLAPGGPFPSGGFAQAAPVLPDDYAVEAAYPNPFMGRTTLRLALPEAAAVTLTVYDALGREVARPVDGRLAAGWHDVVFEGRELPAGVYLWRVEAGAFTETGRVVRAR